MTCVRSATRLRFCLALFAALLLGGCTLTRPPEPVEPTADPVISEPAPAPVTPPPPEPEPAPPVRQVARLVPESSALFFASEESRKVLTVRNDGNARGSFSLLIPDELSATSGGTVSFEPAAGTVAAGESVTIDVRVERDDSLCDPVLRLARLSTDQGTQNISINYTNTGRPDLRIDHEKSRGLDSETGNNIIDFGKESDATAEFTVANRGCAAGSLTILKSGLHEDKLSVPEGPFVLASGQPQRIELLRPDEKFFLGTRNVTLLIRQDNATVGNVEVRWSGLSLLP